MGSHDLSCYQGVYLMASDLRHRKLLDRRMSGTGSLSNTGYRMILDQGYGSQYIPGLCTLTALP